MKTIFLCILVLCFTFVCCEVSNPFERILGQSCPYKSMQQCETTHICPCRTEDYGKCDGSIQLSDFTLNPDTLSLGHPFDISYTITSEYELLKPVIALNIYGLFSINTLTYDICDVAVEKGQPNPCPLPPVKNYHASQSLTLPSAGLIPATYCGYAIISDGDNIRGCTGFVITIGTN